jgi:hypothetical protein
MKGYAKFSRDRNYRYLLGRLWEPEDEAITLTWVMLNPSTADASRNSPTIRKCIEFTRREGYGGLWVVNLFALRSPDSSLLRDWPDPVGPSNDAWLLWAVKQSPTTVLAWGSKGAHWPMRVTQVMEMLQYREPHKCLGRTGSGQPRHPLMLDNNTRFEDYGQKDS